MKNSIEFKTSHNRFNKTLIDKKNSGFLLNIAQWWPDDYAKIGISLVNWREL